MTKRTVPFVIIIACVFASALMLGTLSACTNTENPWVSSKGTPSTPQDENDNSSSPDTSLPNEKEASSLDDLIREQVVQIEGRYAGIEDIPIAFATDGEDTWAIASPHKEGLDGDQFLYIFKIEGTAESPKPVFAFLDLPPKSPGISLSLWEYNGKLLVCGGISDWHFSVKENRRIDLSLRSYLIIESQTEALRIPVDRTIPCAYICILDSKLEDIVIFNKEDAVLFKLSEHLDDIYFTDPVAVEWLEQRLERQ
ncbi:MAG: hypothetical protein FWF91_02540 [Coriobacteriia bacterium]|nr:hypothetical protein [Coriobacteriia bacterium]